MDSITPLLSFAKSESIFILNRTIIEIDLQILFILNEDTNTKAKSYIYFVNYSKLKSIYDSENPNSDIYKILDKFYIKIDEELKEKMNTTKLNLENLLNSESFFEITKKDKDFHKLLYKNYRMNFWFQIYNVKLTSIRKMMSTLSSREYYKYSYKFLSQRVHSTDVISDRFVNDNKNGYYYDIRYPFEFNSILDSYFTQSIKFIQEYISIFIPEKSEILNSFYINVYKPQIEKLKKETSLINWNY